MASNKESTPRPPLNRPLHRYRRWQCWRCAKLDRESRNNIYATCVRCEMEGVAVEATTGREESRTHRRSDEIW
jgi:hypothetical protein